MGRYWGYGRIYLDGISHCLKMEHYIERNYKRDLKSFTKILTLMDVLHMFVDCLVVLVIF